VTSLDFASGSLEQVKTSEGLPITEDNTFFIPSVISSNESFHLLRTYYAVLVGINNYPGIGNDLRYSVNQINAFKSTLLNGGNWAESNIQTLTDYNATKSAILSAIQSLAAKEDRNDLSVLYLIGHGGSNASYEVFITPEGFISDKELAMAVDVFEGDLVIIIDCCHSGGFIEELRGRNRIIMTACEKNELTYQYDELHSGFFGYFLNLTLEKLTKTTETTFLLARPLTIRYCQQLSEELGSDYVVHPCISDGTLGLMKLINRHPYLTSSLKTIFIEPFFTSYNRDLPRRIWRQ
jgi:hypothetical protein